MSWRLFIFCLWLFQVGQVWWWRELELAGARRPQSSNNHRISNEHPTEPTRCLDDDVATSSFGRSRFLQGNNGSAEEAAAHFRRMLEWYRKAWVKHWTTIDLLLFFFHETLDSEEWIFGTKYMRSTTYEKGEWRVVLDSFRSSKSNTFLILDRAIWTSRNLEWHLRFVHMYIEI